MAIRKYLIITIVLLFFAVTFALTKTAMAQDILTGERIQGVDRYGTNLGISKLGWQNTSSGWQNNSGIAVIATGENFPDALSAAPLAGKYKAPILLTNSRTLGKSLKDEIERLGIRTVYIVGGTGVVSQAIQDQLTGMGINCIRLSGTDRYGTSAAVAQALGPSNTVVLATGENYPDALSAAPWAASKGIPILLTERGKLSQTAATYIRNNSVSKAYVIGGTGVVSDSVVSMLPRDTTRISGNDRFGTNLAVLKQFYNDFNLGKLYLATGNNFPDALSGSAIASLSGSPIILTDSGGLPGMKQFVDSNTSKLSEVYLLGGSGVVTDTAVESILPPICIGLNINLPGTVVGLGKAINASVNATMIPKNAPKPVIALMSGNPQVASFGADGIINGISLGNTDITASFGSLSVKKTITVRQGKLIVLDPGHGGWSSGAVPTTVSGTKLPEYREAVLNMEIVQKIKDKLDSLGGYTTVLTREGDTYKTLEERAQIANDLNADMFISIHHDAFSPSSTGTSTYYSDYKPGVDTDDIYVKAVDNGPVYDENNVKIGSLTSNKIYSYIREENGDIYIVFNGQEGKVSLDDVLVYDYSPSIVSQKSEAFAEAVNEGIASLGLPKKGAFDHNLAVTRLANCVSTLVEVGYISNPYEFQKISQDSFQDKVADQIVLAIQNFYVGN